MWNNFLNSPPALQAAALLYVAAALAYVLSLFIRSRVFNWVCVGLFTAAFLCNTAFEIFYWLEAGRPPMRGRFEAIILFTWSIALMSLVMELVNKVRFIGIFGSLFSALFMALGIMWMEPLIGHLPPALQSDWFFPHVIVYFFGYGAAAVAFFSGLALLVLPDTVRLKRLNLLGDDGVDLDHITYRVIAFSFVMLTLGMIMGALWANDAWGTYWGWDPKENWALVSFLVYGLYLHFRLMRGWRGRKAAWFAVLGFVAVLITFLGVSYLPSAGQSIHVYID